MKRYKIRAAVAAMLVCLCFVATAQIGDEIETDTSVENELARLEAERERKTSELSSLEKEQSALKARESELDRQLQEFRNQLRTAEAQLSEAYSKLTRVSQEFESAKNAEFSGFRDDRISDLQAVYDNEHANQLAMHRRDVGFVEGRRWRPDDFARLDLQIGHEGEKELLRVRGGSMTVQGRVPLMDFESGVPDWLTVSQGTRAKLAVQELNPFVAEVTIRGLRTELPFMTTNSWEHDVTVYVAKNFEADAGVRFEVLGVSWYADIGRPTCWQILSVPVFEVTPQPEVLTVTEDSEEIADVLDDWEFDDMGLTQRLRDAQQEHKTAHHTVSSMKRRLPRLEDRAKTQREKLRVKMSDKEEEILDLQDAVGILTRQIDELQMEPEPEEEATEGEDVEISEE